MTALYHGTLVRVVRVESHRAYIVWRGKLKRVNVRALEGTGDREQGTAASLDCDSETIPCGLSPVASVIDLFLIAALAAALLGLAWAVWR